MKKTLFILVLLIACAASAFAGVRDFSGKWTLATVKTSEGEIKPSPRDVKNKLVIVQDKEALNYDYFWKAIFRMDGSKTKGKFGGSPADNYLRVVSDSKIELVLDVLGPSNEVLHQTVITLELSEDGKTLTSTGSSGGKAPRSTHVFKKEQ